MCFHREIFKKNPVILFIFNIKTKVDIVHPIQTDFELIQKMPCLLSCIVRSILKHTQSLKFYEVYAKIM